MAAPTRFSATHSRALVTAVFAMFFVNGCMIGAWGGSLPGLRDRVGTDAAGVSGWLIAAGISAIVSMNVAGRVSDRITPRAPTLVGGVIMCAALIVGSLATHYVVVLLAAIVMGLGNGTMDVAMNALGVDAEKASGKPVMSRFHAFFSLGSFVGAALVLGASRLDDSHQPHPGVVLSSTAIAALVALAILEMRTPRPQSEESLSSAPESANQSAPDAHPAAEQDAGKIPTQAWLLGIMALFFGFTEGTSIDWASIHVTDVAHVNPGVGAAGLACVSATMVGIRLAGDSLVSRFGRVAVVRFGAPVAVVGYVITVFCSNLALILIGWLLVGLGVGMIAPQIYGIAGHLGGGRVLALVTGCGYTAFLAGPAAIGFLSEHVGIAHAMVLPLVAGIALTALTFTAALRDDVSQTGSTSKEPAQPLS